MSVTSSFITKMLLVANRVPEIKQWVGLDGTVWTWKAGTYPILYPPGEETWIDYIPSTMKDGD